MFFIVARPDNSPALGQLEDESRYFGDIVIANINETYMNLALKTLIGIKIVTCFCPNAKYVIKTDDDVYLLPKKFEQVLSHLSGKDSFCNNFMKPNI